MLTDFKCPHCEIRMKAHANRLRCGICGSEFKAGELSLPERDKDEVKKFALEHLRSFKEQEDLKKGDLLHVHTNQLPHVPQWKLALSYFGMPVEEESDSLNFPVVLGTYFLVCVGVFFLGASVSKGLALDPTRLSKLYGLSLFSYSLAHADLFHLLGNVFFAFPFIDDVEYHLGYFRSIVFLFSSATASALLHLFFSNSQLPLVGASGVCSAIVVFYALSFPDRRLLIAPPFLGILAIRYRLRVKARSFALFFVTWEAFNALLMSKSGVSHFGHIGGAVTGALFYLMIKDETL